MTLKRTKAYRYGLRAEFFAALYLRCKGYRIMSERFRNAQGEIDIVACKGRTLVAVEVKARKTLEQCQASIAPWKQRKIARAVQGLLGRGKFAGLGGREPDTIRFDVIWIVPYRWPVHLKDAWRL